MRQLPVEIADVMSLNRKLHRSPRHRLGRVKWMFVWLAGIVFGGSMVVEMRAANARSKQVNDPAHQLFAQHCQKCHSGAKPKGDFRIEQLSENFADRKNRDQWLKVLEQIRDGEMPPKCAVATIAWRSAPKMERF